MPLGSHVNGETELVPSGSQHLGEANDINEASSSKQKPEATKPESGIIMFYLNAKINKCFNLHLTSLVDFLPIVTEFVTLTSSDLELFLCALCCRFKEFILQTSQ